MDREKFECRREELTIRGYVFRNGDNGRRPAVILSHGFLGNQGMCRKYAELLADMGYAAFTFDFCGGGLRVKSDGNSRDMSVLTEKEDLISVISFVKGLPYVDADRVSLLGCSQGGYVSAMVAAEHPELVDRLILFYPALCIPDDARSGKMMFYKFDPENIPDILGKHPMPLGGQYAGCVIDTNPFEQIKGFTGPVLILHGTADRIVKPDYSRKAAEGYPDCRLEIIEGGGHGFSGRYDSRACDILRSFMKI